MTVMSQLGEMSNSIGGCFCTRDKKETWDFQRGNTLYTIFYTIGNGAVMK